jgi:hypothetical protein
VRSRAIGWNRREARGGPRVGRGRVSLAFALILTVPVLTACLGDGSSDDGAEPTVAETSGPPATTAAAADETTQAEASGGWTNYVPLDEPGDAPEPSRRRERAICDLTEFRLFLDSERGVSAVLDDSGRIVASASVTSRAVAERACRATTPRWKRYRDDPEPSVAYESGAVRCTSPRAVEIETFPILDARDDVWGSNLVVSLQGRPLAIAGAITVQDTNGRRLYYLPQYCERL